MNTHRSVQFDRATVEALLRGDSGVRQRAGRLGEHLAAAAAPARPYELAGLPAALDAFQAAGASPATDHRRISVTRTWLAKLLTVKAAALLAITAAGGGVALAATTGTLPNPLSHHAGTSASEKTDDPGRPSSTPTHPAKGSAAPSPSLVGLCHAFTAGAGSDHGKALESPAFTALITAAGGKDKVEAFCKATLASASAHPGDGHPSAEPSAEPSGNPGKDGAHPTGPPSGHPTPTHSSH